MIRPILILTILFLAGCANQSPSPDKPKSAPVAAAAAAEAIIRADEKLEAVEEVLPSLEPEAQRTQVQTLVGEARKDLSAGVDYAWQAEKQSSKLQGENNDLKAADPLRSALRWTAYALFVAAVAAAVGAFWLKSLELGTVAGLLGAAGAGFAAIARYLGPITAITLAALSIVVITAVAYICWLAWSRRSLGLQAGAIVKSIDTAVQQGRLVISNAAADVISSVQAKVPGTKQLVDKHQSKR